MGTPPGYASAHPIDGDIPAYWIGTEDHTRWLAMPAELRAELKAYYDGVQAGTIQDRTRNFGYQANPENDIPCLWYDLDAKRCKHHEHRPDVCREFDVGGPECKATRQHFRIPLPVA